MPVMCIFFTQHVLYHTRMLPTNTRFTATRLLYIRKIALPDTLVHRTRQQYPRTHENTTMRTCCITHKNTRFPGRVAHIHAILQTHTLGAGRVIFPCYALQLPTDLDTQQQAIYREWPAQKRQAGTPCRTSARDESVHHCARTCAILAHGLQHPQNTQNTSNVVCIYYIKACLKLMDISLRVCGVVVVSTRCHCVFWYAIVCGAWACKQDTAGRGCQEQRLASVSRATPYVVTIFCNRARFATTATEWDKTDARPHAR